MKKILLSIMMFIALMLTSCEKSGPTEVTLNAPEQKPQEQFKEVKWIGLVNQANGSIVAGYKLAEISSVNAYPVNSYTTNGLLVCTYIKIKINEAYNGGGDNISAQTGDITVLYKVVGSDSECIEVKKYSTNSSYGNCQWQYK